MMCRSFRTALLMVILSLLIGQLFAVNPKPVGFVNDFAGLMSETTRNQINDWAIELREKTGTDFFLATFKDIGGANEVDFSVQLYKDWAIGSKRDEGVLILLALQERKLRIEVGYGAEGYITDAYANQVYDTMRSFLTKGSEDWDKAFTQGSLLLLSKLAAEKGVTLTGMSQYSQRSAKQSGRGSGLGIILLFVFLMIVTKGRILEVLIWMSILGGRGGGSWGGGSSGGSWGGGSSGGFGGFGGFGGGGGGRSGGGGAGGGF